MRVINDQARKDIRSGATCEHCGIGGQMEAAHIFSRGAGQIDARWNLVRLRSQCHYASHYSGVPTRDDLLLIASKREKVQVESIVAAVYFLRQLSKNDSPMKIEEQLLQLPPEPQRMAREAIKEML